MHGASGEFFRHWTLLQVTGTTPLIIVGTLAWVNRTILSNRTLVCIGKISYPLYLWHWPFLSFARVLEGKEPSVLERLALIALSVALAALTFMYIEKPMRCGRWRKHAVPARSILMLIVAAAGAYIWKGGDLQFRSLSQKEKRLKHSELASFYTMVKYTLPRCGDNSAIVGHHLHNG